MAPTYDELVARLQEKEAENVGLRAENAWLKKQLFGPGKSEKTDRLQGSLPLGDTPAEPVPAKTEQISYERVASPRPKRETPAEAFQNVPVKETVTIEPEEVQANPQAWERIGEERTFEIDVKAPEIYKREIIRPKYRHKADRSQPPVVAPAPPRPVAGGDASAGLLAWIAFSKYVEHVPLYRLERQSERWGAAIPRQTMADWVRITAEWLEPIYRQMHRRLLRGGYLQADETPIRCNDPDEKHGGTTEGWLWVISRPGEDVVFDWRLSRRHGELPSLIDGFTGILQADAWGAYESYARAHPEVTRVGCWAHARRKFFEAESENPKAVRFVLRIIGWLYECEARWDEHKLTASNRRRHRQKHYTRPLYWLHKVALGLRQQALPKSGLGKACDYLLRNWEPLTKHLELGETRIDNNLVENVTPSSGLRFLLRDGNNSELGGRRAESVERPGGYRRGGNSGLCDGLQECEQPGGLIMDDAGRGLRFGESAEALRLHFQVRLDVAMSRLRTGMSQVERDHLDGDARLEQRHGATVPESMGCDPSALERRALGCSFANGQLKPIGDPVVTQGPAAAAGENARLSGNVIALAPLVKQPSCSRPYRSLAILSALAVKLNKAVVNVRGTQLQGLGDPCPGIVKGQEQEKIASPRPRMLVDGREHGFDLVARQEAEHAFGVLFLRDGQNALACGEEIQSGRLTENETGKGTDSREPKVARGRAVAAGTLQMIQKSENRLGGEGRQGEPIDRAAMVLGEKSQEEPEGSAVAGPRFGAEVALCGEVIGKEPLYQARKLKRRHDDGCETEGTSRRRRVAKPDRWKYTTRSS